MIMDKFFEIEKAFSAIDFSREHEKAVWAKIAASLRRDVGATPSGEFDDIAGGLSYIPEYCNDPENPRKIGK